MARAVATKKLDSEIKVTLQYVITKMSIVALFFCDKLGDSRLRWSVLHTGTDVPSKHNRTKSKLRNHLLVCKKYQTSLLVHYWTKEDKSYKTRGWRRSTKVLALSHWVLPLPHWDSLYGNNNPGRNLWNVEETWVRWRESSLGAVNCSSGICTMKKENKFMQKSKFYWNNISAIC